MAKFISLLLFLGLSVFMKAQTLKLISTSPGNNEKVSILKDVTLNFDLSEVYANNPDISPDSLAIAVLWNGDSRKVKLYEGDYTENKIVASQEVTYKENLVYGSTSYTFSFSNPPTLEEGKKYTLYLNGYIIARTSKRNLTKTKYNVDTYVTLIGDASEDFEMVSSIPALGGTIDSISTIKLKFNNKTKISDLACAKIYEGEEIYAQTTDFTVNTENDSVVNVNFGDVILYNEHNYKIEISKGSILSQEKGDSCKAILKEFKGSSYKQLCTLVAVSPSDGSEIKYLKDVEFKLSVPSGYTLGNSTKGNFVLYKAEEETPIGTYFVDVSGVTSVTAHINNYSLEAGSMYKLVLPSNVVVPRLSGTYSDLKDTSNPEITVTYTTPADLQPVPRAKGLTVSSTADGKITVLVPPYTFDGTTTFVRPNSDNSSVEDIKDEVEEKTRTFVTVPIYEVINGEDVDKGTVKLEYNPAPDGAGDNVTGLEGTPDFSLYEGHTYKIIIPEGVLYPYTYEGEYKNSAFWNLADTLSFEGAKAINGLAVTGSSLKAGEALPSVGVVAFYTNEDATATDGAKIQIVKEGETTAAKEAALFIKGTSVLADFTDDAHAPFATDTSAVYSLVLPEGSLIGPDGILTNAADTVKFTGVIPTVIPETEYVSATLSLDGYASGTTKVVKDETATFTIAPADGWKLAALTLNDADVLSDYAEGAYTTPTLAADATVAATFEFEGYTYECSEATGIVNAEGTGYSIKVDGQTITLSGLNSGDAVSVYTLGGALIDKQTAEYSTAKIGVPAGTYIVKVGQTAFKTIVK